MNDLPAPLLHPLISITALIAEAEVLGRCVDGYRVNYPIIGGHFSGPLLRGEVLPGGVDCFLLRQDGVGVNAPIGFPSIPHWTTRPSTTLAASFSWPPISRHT